MNGLTPRELDVMVALAVTGESYTEVARMLGIKLQTAKNHAASARAKYGARSNADLYRKAGWLRVPVDVFGAVTDEGYAVVTEYQRPY